MGELVAVVESPLSDEELIAVEESPLSDLEEGMPRPFPAMDVEVIIVRLPAPLVFFSCDGFDLHRDRSRVLQEVDLHLLQGLGSFSRVGRLGRTALSPISRQQGLRSITARAWGGVSTFNRAAVFMLHDIDESLGTSILDDNRLLKKFALGTVGLAFAGLLSLTSANLGRKTARMLLKLLSVFLVSSLLGSMMILWNLFLRRPRKRLLKICCIFTCFMVVASGVCALTIVLNGN